MILVPPSLQSPPPPSHLVRHVVLVRSQEAGDPRIHQGSGVVVAPGLVATNAHVVGEGNLLRVVIGDQSWPARPRAIDPARDLALLDVPNLPAPPATLAAQAPSEGEPLTYAGFPGGKGPMSRKGHFVGTWAYLGGQLLQVDMEISSGASGGGLFNGRGELVGLVAFQLRGRPRVVFAPSSRWIEAQARAGETPANVARAETLSDHFTAQMALEPANRSRWQAFTQAWVRETPGDPDAFAALGMALSARMEALREEGAASGDLLLKLNGEIRAAQEKAIALRWDRARDWHNLGVTLDRENRFPEALEAHREAVRLQPSYAPGWEGLGATVTVHLVWRAMIARFGAPGQPLFPTCTSHSARQMGRSALRGGPPASACGQRGDSFFRKGLSPSLNECRSLKALRIVPIALPGV